MRVQVHDLVIDARLVPVSAEHRFLRVGGCFLRPADVVVMGLHLQDATEPERRDLEEAGFIFAPADQVT